MSEGRSQDKYASLRKEIRDELRGMKLDEEARDAIISAIRMEGRRLTGTNPSDFTIRIVGKFNPIDDLFFGRVIEDNKAACEVISTMVGTCLKVIFVRPQRTIINLRGRSVRVDAFAIVDPVDPGATDPATGFKIQAGSGVVIELQRESPFPQKAKAKTKKSSAARKKDGAASEGAAELAETEVPVEVAEPAETGVLAEATEPAETEAPAEVAEPAETEAPAKAAVSKDAMEKARLKMDMQRRMRFIGGIVTDQDTPAGTSFGEIKNLLLLTLSDYDVIGTQRLVSSVVRILPDEFRNSDGKASGVILDNGISERYVNFTAVANQSDSYERRIGIMGNLFVTDPRASSGA